MAFLRRRLRSVPSLPPPRFALGLAFVKSGSPRLYAPPSRSRIGAERQASPTPIPARESILVLAGRAEKSMVDDYKAVTPIFIFEKCPPSCLFLATDVLTADRFIGLHHHR